jgi:ZIP family zinc transporter
MNRVVLDGMLGFTGGVMVAASFGLLAPAIEMTGGEGFAKVMPAAFGFPWCLIYFGIDKVPIFISILKLAGIKSPWQRTTLLVSAITLHNIRRIGCWSSFGGVAAGIPEALGL